MLTNTTKALLRDLGLLLHVPAVLTLPTLCIIFIFGEWMVLPAFLIMTALSLASGQVLYRLYKPYKRTGPGSSMVLVSLSWLLIPLLGAIPFAGTAYLAPHLQGDTSVFLNLHSAIFESMSGFTGTGLTMVNNPSTLPYSLQWWRSLSEWLGGIGIIFLALEVLDINHDTNSMYEAETMNWTLKNGNTIKTINKIWLIYAVYTICSILAFLAAGMPFWESLNHGLTGISTGGFSVNSDSFISYSSTIKIVAIIIMLVGAFSFKIHYYLLSGKPIQLTLNNTQLRYFVVTFIVLCSTLLIINQNAAWVDTIFQAASALGTCGFNSVEISGWYMPVIFLLNIAMVLGGNGSSTTGGIKTSRLAWIIKGIKWRVDSAMSKESSRSEAPVLYNGEQVGSEQIKAYVIKAGLLVFIWIALLVAGTLAMAIMVGDQYSLHALMFDVSSALSNVGLSAGVSGHQMPTAAKWLFVFLMWAGRLEIFAVMVLFTTPFYTSHKKQAK
jgi:trk system potassium uptake protein